ncbi:ABC transporter substrate-binding protein [Saccharothrix algeriensis]|uniref:ABC transporter substrate-binding protein n=1 Tax=Saccharothrix algeriensis TaxID=173560 RepID=A0A8T8I1E5_9PSEU|nr:ABC transporter substrate-binding protein [Saccharothrix algeriensis]MBM7809427.1 iron complex transport system substrate-binding protein [Saccharothrix algeriensis]QTR03764.1 ABC transporter substrate-binding protein [Saccharothrix algeriensis]
MRTLALVVAAGLLAAGCTAAPAEETPRATPVVRTAEPLAASLSITDPHGTRVELDEPAERIVCLNGLCDDLVVDLGLTPVGTSNAALITHPALLGEAGRAVPVVPGTFGGEDVEAIAGLRPDLVIGLPGVHDALRPAIEKFAPLWTAEPATWEESVGYLRALGALTGRTDQAVRAEETFRGHLADAVAATHGDGRSARKVLLMYGSADSIGVDTTASLKGHLLGQLFTYPFPAKGADVDTANNYSVEELLAKQPDVVFVYSLLFSAEDRTLSGQLADNPVWRQIPAVRGQRVHEMHAKLWGSGRGLRSLSAVVDEAVAKVAA